MYKRSLDGNASAANANLGLEGAKDAARVGRHMLERYKRSYGAASDVFLSHYSQQQKSGGVSNETVSTSVDDLRAGRHYPPLVSPLASDRAKDILLSLADFVHYRIIPAEETILKSHYEPSSAGSQWSIHPMVESLKEEAKALGLWNLFLPVETDKGKYGASLTNLEV